MKEPTLNPQIITNPQGVSIPLSPAVPCAPCDEPLALSEFAPADLELSELSELSECPQMSADVCSFVQVWGVRVKAEDAGAKKGHASAAVVRMQFDQFAVWISEKF